jgi:hypothetical protein
MFLVHGPSILHGALVVAGLMLGVIQHSLVHHPLETQYDSVVDELQIDEPQLSYLGNLHRRCSGYSPLTLPR